MKITVGGKVVQGVMNVDLREERGSSTISPVATTTLAASFLPFLFFSPAIFKEMVVGIQDILL